MISILVKFRNKFLRETGLDHFEELDLNNLIWIDLLNPTEDEKEQVERFLQINLQTRQQVEEIETSSRYLETQELIIANSSFLVSINGSFYQNPVSFLIKRNILITLRMAELRVFNETIKKIETNLKAYPTGYHILATMFETRIDLDADFIENLAKDISYISKRLSVEKDLDEKMILEITKYQESTMLIRENIIDKQRVISGILKSELFPNDCNQKFKVMIKDIGSLLDYTTFNFGRLEYLQNTFLGLINIEQNKIIKIFTVASVAFMPPTLIASIYGMNFKFLPELNWTFGYVFALFLIISSSLGTLSYFRRKKWV